MLAHDCHSLEKDCYVNSIAKQRASVTLFTGNVIDTYNVTGYTIFMIRSFAEMKEKEGYPANEHASFTSFSDGK